jgi:hypothetical protein
MLDPGDNQRDTAFNRSSVAFRSSGVLGKDLTAAAAAAFRSRALGRVLRDLSEEGRVLKEEEEEEEDLMDAFANRHPAGIMTARPFIVFQSFLPQVLY